MTELLAIYKNYSYKMTFTIATVILSIGLIATMTFIYIGTYKPDLKYLAVAGLSIFSLIFFLTIIGLLLKWRSFWEILMSIPVVLILAFLTILSIDSIKTIFELGWLKCEICP